MKTSDTVSFDDLPLVAEMFAPSQVKEVAALLIELDSLTDQQKLNDARMEDIKKQLEEFQTTEGLPGFQLDRLCFTARVRPGRETLDRGLLIENGVKPSVIARSIKTGNPYIERRFVRRGER
jgi:hypothetical protein